MHAAGTTKRRGFGLSAFLIVGAVALTPWATASPSAGVFARFESTWISEPEPIKTTLQDWGDGFGAGERQWNLTELEVGFRSRVGFEFSVLQRALVDLRVNEDAAAFYGRVKRKKDLAGQEQVPVQVDISGFSAQGLRAGYAYTLDQYGVNVGFRLSVLRTDHLMAGGLDGRFRTFSEHEYDFEAAVDYVYYKDVIFERPNVDHPSGVGWAADLYAIWSPSSHLRFELEARDLAGNIRWKDVPFTRATASTDRKRYDEDGYAVFDPLLRGVEGYLDEYHQRLDPRIKLAADYFPHSRWGISAEAHRQFEYNRAGIGGVFRSGDQYGLKLLYWPGEKAVSMAAEWQDWSASLMLDHVDWQEVQSLGVTFSYRYR